MFCIPVMFADAAVALSISYGLAGVLVAIVLGTIAVLIYAMKRPVRVEEENVTGGGVPGEF